MKSLQKDILYNDEISPGYFRLGISWQTPPIRPGQFVMLRVSDGMDPLLRRPFGVYRVLEARGNDAFTGSGIEVLYRVVGRGTKILSLKRAGEGLNVLGPLGNGFPVIEEGRRSILVAGGMGIAPLYMLIRRLTSPRSAILLFGARARKEAGVLRDFKGLGCRIKVATEDGSLGEKGYVTELLGREVTKGAVIYACGPVGMLKSVATFASRDKIGCYVSLERAMACGIGVCLGCAVRTKTHDERENTQYGMVCSDGPVFKGEDIDWEKL